MKILHLTTHLNTGGISSYILAAGSRMVEKGHEVSVLSSGGAFVEKFKEKGICNFQFPIRTKSEIHPKLFLALPKVIRWVKEEKFDVMHAHTRVTQVLAFFVSRATNVPHVSTAHGFFKPRLARKILSGWGDCVIAISRGVAEELRDVHKIPPSKIRIIQNAIDAPAFQAKSEGKNPAVVKKAYDIQENSVVVSSVGRLVQDKGHAYLVEAVKLLQEKHPDVHLILLGDGREKGRLETLVKKLKLEKRVSIISGSTDVAGALSITDVFVHPATRREGFGLSIMEAMVVKKPVLVTNIPAINTMIEDGVNGFVAEPKSARSLAEKIAFILENPQVAGRAAQKGQEMALKAASLDRQVDELLAVYQKVIIRK